MIHHIPRPDWGETDRLRVLCALRECPNHTRFVELNPLPGDRSVKLWQRSGGFRAFLSASEEESAQKAYCSDACRHIAMLNGSFTGKLNEIFAKARVNYLTRLEALVPLS